MAAVALTVCSARNTWDKFASCRFAVVQDTLYGFQSWQNAAWVLGSAGRTHPRRPHRNWLRRLPDMSLEAHVEELQRRHRALEMEIAEAHAHPSIDDLEIVSLKRRKLLVKDELVRLKN